MVVSLESIFPSLFILMSQNRSGLQADQRNHLDLQINLLSEDENTKMLQMLQALCEHHKLAIGSDPEITAMANGNQGRDDGIERQSAGGGVMTEGPRAGAAQG
jgi:uncharacterized membrane protein